MYGQVRSKELPVYGAKTLAVRHGTLELHGRHVRLSWRFAVYLWLIDAVGIIFTTSIEV